MNQIFSLRNIDAKTWQNTEVYHAFVNLENAYELRDMADMSTYTMDGYFKQTIKSIISSACFGINGAHTDWVLDKDMWNNSGCLTYTWT